MQKVSKRSNDPGETENRRARILAAAKDAFARYGFGRTSMADIAELARLSRPALYEHFASKEDIFRTLAEAMKEQALAAAEAAWPPSLSFVQGLERAILAKDLEFFHLIHLSPHGAEILSTSDALTDDLREKMEDGFAKLIAKRASAAPSPELVGRVIARCADGLKNAAKTEKEYVTSVKCFAQLAAKGYRG